MAYTPPEEMPTTEEELDAALAKVYLEGQEVGKRKLREDIREYLMRKFFGAKGRNRRADPEDPKIQAIREIMEGLYAKFEDGTL
jgi:hypothetical protein